MSLSGQARALAEAGSRLRQQTFGIDQSGDPQSAVMWDEATATAASQPFDCYFTPVRTQEQLDAAMFKDIHDTILRARKDSSILPAIGKVIRLYNAAGAGTDLFVRISELGYSGINPEYVLGCKNI